MIHDLIIDRYIRMVVYRQEKVRATGRESYAFRCPYCGDSKKNTRKIRGYCYYAKNMWFFKCHNCQVARSGQNFIKDQDPELYRKYRLELLQNRRASEPEWQEPEYMRQDETTSPSPTVSYLNGLSKISELPEEHPARSYLTSRRIPPIHFDTIYYTDAFMAWVNTHLPDKFSERALAFDAGRIVLPFRDEQGRVFGATGRAIDRAINIRYVTVMFQKEARKVFGLDRMRSDQTLYVVEGPIDSLFLSNSIAMAGADLADAFLNKEHTIMVFDNEPRNENIVAQVHKYIIRGYRVCVWPVSLKEKDINDLIMAGHSPASIESIIRSNSFAGLRALAALSHWSKV